MTGTDAKVAVLKESNIPGSPSEISNDSLNIIESLLDRTLSLILDIPTYFKDKTVFIKPNLVRPNLVALPAVTTDPRVIIALTKLIINAGAKKVMVGDIPGYRVKSSDAMDLSQLTDKLVDLGAYSANLNEGDIVAVPTPTGTVLKHIKLPVSVRDADIFINLPKLKTHMHTLVSLGIKNLHGLILDDQRLLFHRHDISYKVVDILYSIVPDLTIIDGLWALEGQAPLHGNAVSDFNTMLASTNINAIDAVGTYLMGIEPVEISTCRLACKRGFGPYNLVDIEILGYDINRIRRIFKRPVLSSAGVFDKVDVIEGGACSGCLSALRHSLDRLEFEKKLDKLPKLTIYTGMPMPNTVTLESWDGDLICLGNCASSLVLKQNHVSQPSIFVPGCAPHVLDLKHVLVEKYKI